MRCCVFIRSFLDKKGMVREMKRVLAILMSVTMMAAVLAGCSSEEANLSSINAEKYVTNLFDYKGVELSAAKEVIDDEYVDSYIDFILSQYPNYEEVTDRPVGYGDTANIDYVGKDMDGVAFEGGSAQGYDLVIGSGMFVPGFEDGLVGANTGDTVDVELTFPENYHNADLAAQDVVFTVTINKISTPVPAELTDEFVAQFGNTSVEDFRNSVVIALEDSANATFENELQRQIIDIILEECEFSEDVPEALFEYYKSQIYANFGAYAANYGLDVDTYISQSGMTKEEFEENLTTGATESAREALVCKMIAEKEGISVSDEELETGIQENYMNFGYATPEEYKEAENTEDYRDYLLTAKVLNFIIDNANVTVLTPEEAAQQAETEVVEETAEETTEAATEATTEATE